MSVSIGQKETNDCGKHGEAPRDAAGWPRVRLGEVMRRHNEIIHPGDRSSGEMVFVGLEHIEAGTGRRVGSATVDLARMSGRKPTFRRGHIVYGYLRPYLNKVWIAEFDGCSSVDQFAFEVSCTAAHPGFIAAFLRSETFLQRAANVTTPGQLPRISIDEIQAVELNLPPLVEQERIAARLVEQLTGVERARAAALTRLTAAEALPVAYLREIFEGPVASEWEKLPLREVSEVCGGIQKQPNRSAHTFHRPYLTVRNVQRGSLDLSNVERFEITPNELERLRLKKGDILIVEGNGSPDQIGRNAIFDLNDDEWIHQNHVIRVRLSARADHEFVSRYLNSDAGHYQMLESARSTSGLYTLSVEKVKSLEVPVPPMADQRRIAADLSRRIANAHRLTTMIHDELAAIEALPAAILRAAFNGNP